ncbi:hypothetical protein CcrKarma_gp103 [Caulobacter virus Karma]|uniref:hypothetical protein n=1 Tax=Caulobacter virus Magneto TaxID=1211642 RepID=UPI00028AAF43|nr:hypothetical protein CcrMagneto_gp099 [Caulobacter virus Magneto]YP_006989483.1 hypothetical protein CcrKarma_gp103 [Caulobacter virus Karma]AFU87269.1 hypothetical protein CcrMagneto_gp099 [Caulobacter virus Magneto]AFU87620.1 hypothetical protein CcrKarma_gp103 [Caulobacter virus Karma]
MADGTARVTQETVEIISTGPKPVRLTQETVEVISTSQRPTRLTQVTVEVIRSIGIVTERPRRLIFMLGA